MASATAGCREAVDTANAVRSPGTRAAKQVSDKKADRGDDGEHEYNAVTDKSLDHRPQAEQQRHDGNQQQDAGRGDCRAGGLFRFGKPVSNRQTDEQRREHRGQHDLPHGQGPDSGATAGVLINNKDCQRHEHNGKQRHGHQQSNHVFLTAACGHLLLLDDGRHRGDRERHQRDLYLEWQRERSRKKRDHNRHHYIHREQRTQQQRRPAK